MFCYNCGTKIGKDGKFCHSCGKSISTAPTSEAAVVILPKTTGVTEIIDIEYYSVSISKLVTLSVLTFGLYQIFWFYKNWDAVKDGEKKKMSPLGRSIFAIFYCQDLFKKVLQSAKKYNYPHSFSPGSLSLWYICLTIAINVVARFEDGAYAFLWLPLSVLNVIPLIPVQKAINFNNEQNAINPGHKKGFSGGEVAIIILGLIWVGLILYGMFAS